MKSSPEILLRHFLDQTFQVILSIIVNKTLTSESSQVRDVRRSAFDELVRSFVKDRSGHGAVDDIVSCVHRFSPVSRSKSAR